MSKKHKIIYPVLIMVTVLFSFSYAQAGITISPDRHIVSLLPGEEKTVMYHIYNAGEEDIDITIEPKAWSGLKDPYAWMSLENESIYSKSGASTPLVVNVKVPEEETGEMVAMLFLCYKDSVDSQLNIRNGVPLYMSIKGTEDYGLEIKDIDISYARKGHFYGLNFIVNIKNTGNIHIMPDIDIIIKDSNNKIVNTLSLKRPNIVLRDKDQAYRLGWVEPGLRDGRYKAVIILDYEDKIRDKKKEVEFQVSGNSIEKVGHTHSGD